MFVATKQLAFRSASATFALETVGTIAGFKTAAFKPHATLIIYFLKLPDP